MITKDKPSVMVVYDFDNTTSRAEGDLEAITNLLLMMGNIGKQGAGLILLQKHANTVGFYDMTHASASSANYETFRDKLLSGKIKASVIIGENPLKNPDDVKYFKNMEFIAVMDLFRTETMEYADVVLPASTHAGTGGTFTGLDRKVQRFPAAVPSQAGKNNIEILSALAKGMGKTFDYKNPDDVFNEIKQAIPNYNSIDFNKHEYWTASCENCKVDFLYCCDFATDDGKAVFSVYRLNQQEEQEDKKELLAYNSIDSYFDSKIRIKLLKDVPLTVDYSNHRK
jgi:predicted molibdopterin-dependent oxidoreductase YjgC